MNKCMLLPVLTESMGWLTRRTNGRLLSRLERGIEQRASIWKSPKKHIYLFDEWYICNIFYVFVF